MTPQEIAIEAAEAVKEVANDVLRRHADADPSNQSILIGDAILPECAALILTAAAKIVRESGCLEALAPFATFHECYQAKPMANMSDEFYGIHTGTPHEASIRHTDMKRAAAALTALRALTDHSGKQP